MTDPERLLQTRLDVASREAIQAAMLDEPPDRAKVLLWESIALALPATGVLVGVTTTSSAAATTASTVTGSAGTVAAAGAAGGGTATAGALSLGVASTVAGVTTGTGFGLIAGKAITIGLGIGLAVNVATGVVTRAVHPTKATPTASSAVVVRSAVGAASRSGVGALANTEPSALPVSPAAADRASQSTTVAVATTTAIAVAAAETSSVGQVGEPIQAAAAKEGAIPNAPSSDELREESSLLMRARQALTASQTQVAFELVTEHRRRFAAGKLLQEREALEVQILYRMGDVTLAKARARAFLARYPMSPHREKILAIADESQTR
jgi:hypothetical protein